MSYTKKGVALLALALTLAGASCGRLISPLQSPPTIAPTSVQPSPTTQLPPTAVILPSPTTYVLPSPTEYVAPTVTGTATPIPTITLTPTPGPSPTPDTQQTSAAVYATITALAATPTYPPTSTPRSRRTPIGAGPDEQDIPPTALYSEGNIAVLTLSQQVVPGGAAALTIKTQPAASCSVKISRGAGGQASLVAIPGAPVRVAGRDGTVAWIWTVDAKEPTGIMALVIDCGAVGKAHVQIKVTQ